MLLSLGLGSYQVEAWKRSGLRCNGAAAKARVRMLKMSGFCGYSQPALESSKNARRQLTEARGRITVDAREKGFTQLMMQHL